MKLDRVAVFRPGRAGDFILTTPLFNAIKEFSPTTHVTVITSVRAAELARWHPAIDRTLVFEASPGKVTKLVIDLWRCRFDLWIDPKDHLSGNSRIFGSLARAGRKIGFNGPILRPFDLALSHVAETGLHFVDQALLTLDVAGIPRPASPRISLGLPPASERWAAEQVGSAAATVLINISAGSPQRFWPVEQWAQLLPLIAGVGPVSFLLTSAPEDAAHAAWLAAEAVRQGLPLRRLPRGSLLDVAAVVKRANLVLTPDTSVVHLAAAFDRPVVALYLREYPGFSGFQPRSTQQRVLAAEPGAPMDSISVESVASAYRELAVDSAFRF